MDTMTAAKNVVRLAIDGGEPVRRRPMPPRFALGDAEAAMIQEVIKYYRDKQVDPGYQGTYERAYTDAFVKFMGGGYADAVATGTASLYVAVAALDLPPGSEVIVSPITDPGTLSAIILNRLVPRVADSEAGTFNMGPEQFVARITPQTRAVMLVHSLGRAADVVGVVKEAHARGIRVIEDCSQSHGARVKGRPIGNFGDIAAFSTMYRKAHMTGGAGGVVFTRDIDLHHRALAAADRGKPSWRPDFDDRNPNQFLFPALNFHTDEISCAIGISSLRRLADTLLKRLTFVAELTGRLNDRAEICKPYGYSAKRRALCVPDHRRYRPYHLQQRALCQGSTRRRDRSQPALSVSRFRLALVEILFARRFRHAECARHARPLVHALSQRKLRQLGSGRYR